MMIVHSEMKQEKEKNFVYNISIINTSMAGCEYDLFEGKTRFRISNREVLSREQEEDDTLHTLYILDDMLDVEFIIENRTNFTAPILIDGVEKGGKKLAYQELHEVMGFKFRLKNETDIWSEITPELAEEDLLPFPPNVKSGLSGTNMLLVALIVILTGIGWAALSTEGNEAAAVSEIIGSVSDNLTTFMGVDGRMYVFADGNLAKIWASQSLIRNGTTKEVKVIKKNDEKDKILRIISLNSPRLKYHKLNLDDPINPELTLSYERNNEPSEESIKILTEVIRKKVPYIESLRIAYALDRHIEKEADNGIKNITESFQKKKHISNIVYNITGPRDDAEILSLKTFVYDFKKKWPGGYVIFNIILDDDEFKDKSMFYGDSSVVKKTPEHWHFSK